MVARWSFRLTLWGLIFAWDIVLWRNRKKTLEKGEPVWAFAAKGAQKLWQIPKRTLGRLSFSEGILTFSYRKFLIFPKLVTIPQKVFVGKRISFPDLVTMVNGGTLEFFYFRFSARGHEEALVSLLRASGVLELGLLKESRKVLAWFKGLFMKGEGKAFPSAF
jgi:hypothetical protein